jgi:excisionase family DNA binding protein
VAADLLPFSPTGLIEDSHDDPATGLTVREVAKRYRVGEDKIRSWIAKGELKAINTSAALCGRPRWVIPREALEEFEKRRRSGPTQKSQRPRRRRVQQTDYYPD